LSEARANTTTDREDGLREGSRYDAAENRLSRTDARRGRAPLDLAAVVRALLLSRRAQRVESRPVAEVVSDLMRSRGRDAGLSAERLTRAASRATSRWARWRGSRDTCLIRSLVLGTMLSSRGCVELTIGFRSGAAEETPEGHAWLTLDGQPVGEDATLATGDYVRLMVVPFEK
jgi:hypothetical protein